MKVNEVEIVCPPANLLQHHDVQRARIAHRRVEEQRLRPHRHEFGRRAGIAAGKERDFVPVSHKFFGNPVDYALCAAIEPGRNGLG